MARRPSRRPSATIRSIRAWSDGALGAQRLWLVTRAARDEALRRSEIRCDALVSEQRFGRYLVTRVSQIT
jgi:hypothetical protein